MMNSPQALLLLRLRVQNANAVSSPLTWGFPPPSAFTGFVHALGLRVAKDPELEDLHDLVLDGAGIVCHRFEPQTYTPAGKRTQVFALTRNPVDKDGKTAAIVEEGRAHLEVTLVIGVYGEEAASCASDEKNAEWLASRLYGHACAMRLAGGSILPVTHTHGRSPAALISWPETTADMKSVSRQYRHRLLPGFALIQRDDLLEMRLAELPSGATALDALLDFSRLNFECEALPANPEKTDEPLQGKWSIRSKNGWLVPLPVGYAALSELYPAGAVKNARDAETPFRSVESVLSLGEWRSPHRIDDLRQLLWFHQAEPDAGRYLVQQPFAVKPTISAADQKDAHHG